MTTTTILDQILTLLNYIHRRLRLVFLLEAMTATSLEGLVERWALR
ncbi:unnamed protein product, partial [Amoebophrya sp. A25]|eukprot:GSA25T00026911001.1